MLIQNNSIRVKGKKPQFIHPTEENLRIKQISQKQYPFKASSPITTQVKNTFKSSKLTKNNATFRQIESFPGFWNVFKVILSAAHQRGVNSKSLSRTNAELKSKSDLTGNYSTEKEWQGFYNGLSTKQRKTFIHDVPYALKEQYDKIQDLKQRVLWAKMSKNQREALSKWWNNPELDTFLIEGINSWPKNLTEKEELLKDFKLLQAKGVFYPWKSEQEIKSYYDTATENALEYYNNLPESLQKSLVNFWQTNREDILDPEERFPTNLEGWKYAFKKLGDDELDLFYNLMEKLENCDVYDVEVNCNWDKESKLTKKLLDEIPYKRNSYQTEKFNLYYQQPIESRKALWKIWNDPEKELASSEEGSGGDAEEGIVPIKKTSFLTTISPFNHHPVDNQSTTSSETLPSYSENIPSKD